MSVIHLRFDEPQNSFVCTCCGKFPIVDAAIAQDAVDHHLSLYCEDCAENIGPREAAGARTATNIGSPKLPTLAEVESYIKGKTLIGSYNGSPSKVELAYDYICRQLQVST